LTPSPTVIEPPTVIPAKAGIHFAVAFDFHLAAEEQNQNGFRLSPE